jgi:hypothetical protein
VTCLLQQNSVRPQICRMKPFHRRELKIKFLTATTDPMNRVLQVMPAEALQRGNACAALRIVPLGFGLFPAWHDGSTSTILRP